MIKRKRCEELRRNGPSKNLCNKNQGLQLMHGNHWTLERDMAEALFEVRTFVDHKRHI